MNQPLLQMDLRLVGVAVFLLGVAAVAIWRAGQKLRGELGPLSGPDGERSPLRASSVPPQAARALQRGLVSPAQLAAMSDAERQLLFDSMGSVINEDVEPAPSPRFSGARAIVRAEEIPALYCPTCGYRIEQFTSTPPITGRCETCRAKVVVRRDGARLLLTVVPTDDIEGPRPGLRSLP